MFCTQILVDLAGNGHQTVTLVMRVCVLVVGFLSQVYRGYVDDPRNTDNSWMETIACHFHDEDGTSVGQFQLHAGKV